MLNFLDNGILNHTNKDTEIKKRYDLVYSNTFGQQGSVQQ